MSIMSTKTATSTTLIDAVIASARNPEQYYDTFSLPDKWTESLLNPKFDNAGQVHDWRNHVHWLAIEFWHQLDIASRLIIYLKAIEDAGNERWD